MGNNKVVAYMYNTLQRTNSYTRGKTASSCICVYIYFIQYKLLVNTDGCPFSTSFKVHNRNVPEKGNSSPNKVTCFSQTLGFSTKNRTLAQIRRAPQQIDHDCSYGNHIQNLDAPSTLPLSQVAVYLLLTGIQSRHNKPY